MYRKSRLDTLKPYRTPIEDRNERAKRSLAAFLGSTVLSLVIGGATEYQIHKVNKHVKENEQNIQSLINDLKAIHSNQIIIANNMLETWEGPADICGCLNTYFTNLTDL